MGFDNHQKRKLKTALAKAPRREVKASQKRQKACIEPSPTTPLSK